MDTFIRNLLKKLDDTPKTHRARLLAAMPFSTRQALDYFIDKFGFKDDFASIFPWLKNIEMENARTTAEDRQTGLKQAGVSSFKRLDPKIIRFESSEPKKRKVAKSVTLE